MLPRTVLAVGLLGVTLLAGIAQPAAAQRPGSGDGYLFRTPVARFALRGGYLHANAGSDLFDDLTDRFILSRSDFGGVAVGAEAGYLVTPRLELSLSADYAGKRTSSEYRHLVDDADLPIEQTHRFSRAAVMGNVRLSLVSRGEQVGRLAWIPTRVVPWVGGGAGVVWYRLSQEGDFVDTRSNEVSFDRLQSERATLGAQAMAGVDVGITPRFGLTADVRSLWARAELDPDYSGYERLDLSGVSATLGLTFRL